MKSKLRKYKQKVKDLEYKLKSARHIEPPKIKPIIPDTNELAYKEDKLRKLEVDLRRRERALTDLMVSTVKTG